MRTFPRPADRLHLRRLAAPAAVALAIALAPATALIAAPAAVAATDPAAASSPAAHTTPPNAVRTATEGALEWTATPADASGEDGRISLRHVADPGESVADHIAVTNLGTAPAELVVQSGDGLVGADGAFDIADGEPTGSGGWITVGGLDGDRLALDAGETRVLPVAIAVPADATPGDHPAGIVVGVSQEADGMTVTHRVGVRVHLQVAGELQGGLAVGEVTSSFTPSWIPFAPGTLTVDLDVENTGNVRLGAAPVVTVSGPLGIAQTQSADAVVELLPGATGHQRIEVPAWPLVALFGDVSVSASSIGEDAIPATGAATAGFTMLAVSWTAVAVLVLLAVVILLTLRRRRAREA